jgi:chemotaxis response regulator CheB
VLYAGFAAGALGPICSAWNKTTFLSVEAVSETITLNGGKVCVLPRNMHARIESSGNDLKLTVDTRAADHQTTVLVSLIRSAVDCLGEGVYIVLSGGLKRDFESVIEGVKLAVEGNAGICFAADPALSSAEAATEIPLSQLGIPSTSADELARRLLLEYKRTNTVKNTN